MLLQKKKKKNSRTVADLREPRNKRLGSSHPFDEQIGGSEGGVGTPPGDHKGRNRRSNSSSQKNSKGKKGITTSTLNNKTKEDTEQHQQQQPKQKLQQQHLRWPSARRRASSSPPPSPAIQPTRTKSKNIPKSPSASISTSASTSTPLSSEKTPNKNKNNTNTNNMIINNSDLMVGLMQNKHHHPSTPLSKKSLSSSDTTQSSRQVGTPETTPSSTKEEEAEEAADWYGQNEYYSSIQAIEKLRNPNIKDVTLYVDDYDNATFQLVIETLLENTALTDVRIYRLQENKNRRIRTPSQMARLFSAVRALRQLQFLELCNMEDSELEMITSVVKQHPTIQTFRLHFTRGGITNNNNNNDDNDFLWSLVNAPLLSDISLEIHKSFPLRILFESKTLTSIHIDSNHFQFKDDHFVDAMQMLEHNKTLETLDMKPRISPLGMRALAFAVDENKGLTTLKFSFPSLISTSQKTSSTTINNNKDIAGKMLLHLIHALTRNSTIHTITNYSAHDVRVRSADVSKMMELLESNRTIEILDIFDDTDFVSHKEELLRANRDRKIDAKGKNTLASWFIAPCGGPAAAMMQCADDNLCAEDFEIVEF